jgi:hypothetical protein
MSAPGPPLHIPQRSVVPAFGGNSRHGGCAADFGGRLRASSTRDSTCSTSPQTPGEPTPSHSLMPVFRRMNWARGSESGLFIGERIYHVSGQRYYDKTLIN